MKVKKHLRPLIFDDTSEFITLIQCNPTAVEFHAIIAMTASSPVKRRPHDISMIPAGIPAEEIEVGEIVVEMDEDEDHIKAGEESESDSENDHGNRTSFQQLQHGSSMASTLSILHHYQQGVRPTPSADQVEIERKQLQHDLWLADQRVNLARRLVKKRFGNGQNMDQAT